jgi:hypothetical protein
VETYVKCVRLPLSKKRMFEILDLYHWPVVMDEVGGYDTGVYFSFKGSLKDGAMPPDKHCGGRLIRPSGFCSESVQITRWELRASSPRGLELFSQRVATRRATLSRWLKEYGMTLSKPHLR